MPSGGKEGKWRAELAAAQKAYRQLVAIEERTKKRLAGHEVAHAASTRALIEAKAYILSMPPQEKPKGMMDPQSATVSLINRATSAIKKATDN